MEEKRYYFDWAASAPPLLPPPSYLPYGNPSSLHSEGRAAKQALQDARSRCAAVLGVPASCLFFTSGGTESNSIALFSNLTRVGSGRIISSLAEHASVREAMETLEKMGKSIGSIAVDSAGKVTPELLSKALNHYGDVRFVSIMAVNNETGAVTDIRSLRDVIRNYSKNNDTAPIHFHCDIVQAVGKTPVDIDKWEIDSSSISAHKIGGPKGIGLLYMRKPLEVFYKGGGQEKGVRGGTENVAGAVAFSEQLTMHSEQFTTHNEGAKARMNRLISELSKIDRCRIIPKERTATTDNCSLLPVPCFSPYILQVAFKDIPGEVMARALDDLGFAVSTGSACSSSSPERPVLVAMGIDERLRIEGIRISQGWSTTDEEIDLLLGGIDKVLSFL